VPSAELPPAIPFTDQLTTVFAKPVTVAVNCWVAPVAIEAFEGLTETDVELVILTLLDAEELESATLVAVTMTLAEGTEAGAL